MDSGGGDIQRLHRALMSGRERSTPERPDACMRTSFSHRQGTCRLGTLERGVALCAT